MKFLRVPLLILLSATWLVGRELPTTTPEDVGLSAERLERIASVMKAHVDAGRLAGGLGLIARGGKVAYFDTWGVRDRETGAPMSRDTIFRIYSMTKPITSVAVMMLYEEGHFLLNDPVSKFLPELAEPDVLVEVDMAHLDEKRWIAQPAKREITIRDLLRHTSGLTYGVFEDTKVDQLYLQAGLMDENLPVSELVAELGELPLKHQPGAEWEYSVSTDVLGRLVEVVSGRRLDEFFEERIFEPLGMRDTGFLVPAEDGARVATLYGQSLPPGFDFDYTRPKAQLSGGGGLASTIDDYLLFCQMLLNGGEIEGVRLLSPKTVELMTRDHLGDIDPGSMREGYGFGLGFAVAIVPGELSSPGEYTWDGIAGTSFFIDPEEEMIGLFMIQQWFELRFRSEFKTLVYQAIVD